MRRLPVGTALLVLLVILAATAALTVPWTVLPGAHPVVDVGRDFSRGQLLREEAFHRSLRPWSFGSLFVALAVAGLLGLTPLGGRLVAAVARPLGGGWPAQVLMGTVAVTAVGRLVTAPLDIRSEVVLRRYGLSTQTWASWTADAFKGLGVAAAVSAIALLVVVGLARAVPRTWWAWGAAATALLVVLGSFGYPLLVEPVFNRFTPLAAGPVRTDLLTLAARDGVPVDDVLVADASRRTSALNAYVSGFGSTRRIVVYDTLLRQASPREVELVVAHELGHAKRQDVVTGTALGALSTAAGICALALLLSWRPLLRLTGAAGPGDPRVVPLVLFLVALVTLLTAPAGNLVSRRIEARADVHALDLTGDVPTFVAGERRLAVTNLSDLAPGPVLYAFFATHPSSPQRIALAREWQRLHAR